MPDNPNRPAAPETGRPATRPGGPGLVAAVLSVVWVAVAAGWVLLTPEARPGSAVAFVVTLLAVVLPVALIWVAVTAARTAQTLREELQHLRAALDQTRAAVMADRQAARLAAPTVERKLAEIAQGTRVPDAPQGTFATTREPPRPRPQSARPPEEQPSLALGPTPEDSAPPLDRGDLIRALNFPDTDKDIEGFAAVRRALRDRRTRQLIQASQDVLTLLSQDGIYMDDLTPDRARPEVWRRFAQGERGRAVAALGGVRDRSCLALTSARMRQDTIFRDAAHHFLRLFDRMLAAAEPEFSDEDIAHLSDTRTARAFMLIGRVTGAFD